MLDLLGRAKWDAWKKKEQLGEDEAKRGYIDSLKKVRRREFRLLRARLKSNRSCAAMAIDLKRSSMAESSIDYYSKRVEAIC